MTAGEALHAPEELLLSEVRKVDDEIQQLNDPSSRCALQRERNDLRWFRENLDRLIFDLGNRDLLDREL